MKTIQSEYCDVYIGDLKNKNNLEEVREKVSLYSIKNGIEKYIGRKNEAFYIKEECVPLIKSMYLEKIEVIKHTEKERKICDVIQITFDPEVIDKYLEKNECIKVNPFMVRNWMDDFLDILKKEEGKPINICLFVDIKSTNINKFDREILKNREYEYFHSVVLGGERDKRIKVIDRNDLNKIIEEQKLSSAGLTNSDTVKIGKLLNLDMIVFRTIYDKQSSTKVLKVDTGEILLLKTDTNGLNSYIY
jgi:hypothetical protein